MLKRVFGNYKGTTARRVSECLEEAFEYVLRLSGYWKIVSGCLQLEEHEQQRITNKNSNKRF